MALSGVSLVMFPARRVAAIPLSHKISYSLSQVNSSFAPTARVAGRSGTDTGVATGGVNDIAHAVVRA